jgi:copper transport protein
VKRLAHGLLVGVLAAVVLTAWTGVASAHALLASSDPANGASLPKAPSEIRLTFTESPDPSLSTILVLDSGGTKLPVGPPTLQPPRTLTTSLPAHLPNGVYTVSWQTVSTQDGHETAGVFAFGVGAVEGTISPGVAPTFNTSGPTPFSVAAKTALYAGLMLLVGAAVVGLGLFGGAPRSLRVVGLAAALLAFGGAIGLLGAEQHTVEVPLNDFVQTATGRPYLSLVVATLAAAIFAVLAAARERWRAALWGSGAAAAVAMAIRASNGHAAGGPDPLLQQAYQWLHFLAAGLWIGGLVLLSLLLRERLGTHRPPMQEARRFSNLAVWLVAVVALTGVLRAVDELGGLSNLLDGLRASYGLTVLGKVAGGLVLIGLGATNRLRNVAILVEDERPLRRFVGAETVVALGVLVLTGVLTGLSPPVAAASAATGPPPVAGSATGADFATTTRVSLTLTPGFAGPNAFRAEVTDYDSGAPVSADAVTLRVQSVTHPDLPVSQIRLTQQMDHQGMSSPGMDGIWVGQGTVVSVMGTWKVTALIRSGASTVEVPMTVITKSDGTTSTVAIPGAPTTTTTSFPDGVSLQSFVDPATAGPNPVHATAFGPNGKELPLSGVVIVVTPDGGEPIRPPTERFSAGHVAANTTLDAGNYVVDIVATARGGRSYESSWRLAIAPAPAG